MKKRFLKKSEVLREGYLKGLMHAKRVINEMLDMREEGDDDGEFDTTEMIVELTKSLMNAVDKGDIEEAEFLLKGGANPEGPMAFDSTLTLVPLHFAAENGDAKMCQLLLNHGATVDVCDMWGKTPLHFAADADSPKVCKVLVKGGADIEAEDERGKTPLYVAAENDREDACIALIDLGADIEHERPNGVRPIDIADKDMKRIMKKHLALMDELR